MGTLTADCPDLRPVHCSHKLPSSCRLTSTPSCCACADVRPHSLTYRIYIDGVGFVQRGTRWQSYCWYCKSFWDARVSATGLVPSDTKIPEEPDQQEFVDRWFEFHRGHRTRQRADGIEERVAVTGEALKDVDPGHLPRTLEEVEAGRRNVLESDRRRRERPTDTSADPQVSLEDALDQLLLDADSDEDQAEVSDPLVITIDSQGAQNTTTSAPQPSETADDNRAQLEDAYTEAQRAVEAAQRVRDRAQARLANADEELAVVRERLRRIRRQQITAGNFARVFGTREDVQSDAYVSPITSMFQRQIQWGRDNAERLRIVQEQRDAIHNFEEINRASGLAEAVTSIDRLPATGGILTATTNIPELPGSSRAMREGLRLEDRTITDSVAALLPQNASVAAPFPQLNNATDSGSAPEASTDQAPPPDDISPAGVRAILVRALAIDSVAASVEFSAALARIDRRREEQDAALTTAYNLASTFASDSLNILTTAAAAGPATSDPSSPVATANAQYAHLVAHLAHRNHGGNQAFPGLDADGRPPPRSEGDMLAKLECKICLQQIADTACLPCGHLTMCEWCAEQWIPCKREDRTRPVDKGVKCPVCRGKVKSRVKIFVG